MIPSYIKNATGVFIVYDITKRSSFESLSDWLNFVKENSDSNCIYILCGNKVDIEDQRQVSYDEAEKFAKVNEMVFYEVSAKTGSNILKLFYHTISKLPVFEDIDEEDKNNIIEKLIEENSENKINLEGPISSGFLKGESEIKVINNDNNKKKTCC